MVHGLDLEHIIASRPVTFSSDYFGYILASLLHTLLDTIAPGWGEYETFASLYILYLIFKVTRYAKDTKQTRGIFYFIFLVQMKYISKIKYEDFKDLF